MKRISITLYYCLSCLIYSFGQDFNIERYTVFEGLPNSNIVPLFEDRLGYLWIGSLNGLARFDGKDFNAFPEFDALSGRHINSIAENKYGYKLIAGPRGLFQFNGKSLMRISGNEELPERNIIDHFATIKDSIFFLTSESHLGLITSDTILWDIPVPIKANRILNYGEKLMLCGQDQLLLFSKTKTENWLVKNRFSKLIKTINYGDSQLLSTDSGLFKIAGNEIIRVFPDINVRVALFSETDSIFWLAPHPPVSGLLQATVSKSKIAIKSFLPSTYRINYAINDSEGNLWFATENKGLIKVSKKSFTKVFDTPIAVTSIARIHNQLWVGTMGDGIHILENGKVKAGRKFQHQGQNVIRVMKEDDSFVWVGSNGGLLRLHKVTHELKKWTRNDGLNSDSIYTIETGPDNRLWIGTRGKGLASFDGKMFKRFSIGTVQEYYVWSMKFIKKDLYLGTDRGLHVVKNGMINEINVDGLNGSSVYSVREFGQSGIPLQQDVHSNLLLLGTNTRGIAVLDPEQKKVSLIGKKDGLVSNCIYNAEVDQNGFIWLNTDHGIQRIRFDSNYKIIQSQVFDSESGFDGIDSNITSRLFDSEIQFGSISGLFKFEELLKDKKAHPLHFTTVELYHGDQELKSNNSNLTGPFKLPEKPEFSHTENHLTFHFNRVFKFSPEAILYRFKLENFETRWSNPTKVNSVTYSNLPPGKYNLLVEATGPDGKWLKDLVGYEFTILSPFYRSTVFYFVGTVVLASIIIGIFYLRLGSKVKSAIALENLKVAENDRLRKELARDFHDEMGNKLSTIINYAALLRFKGASQYADISKKVEDSAKELLVGTRDFIWSIDPISDEINNLFIHIKDFGEKFFEGTSIVFRANNEIRLNYKLPKGFSRQVNLILKEAMTNTYKHSQASNVEFSLNENRDTISFSLEDDGVGIEFSLLKRLNGINNMRHRASKINSKLKIDSTKVGTKIILEIELTKHMTYATNTEKTDTHYRGQ
jgi:signal transduction histidine kinase/ligand-binding sensor domain-containing protein